MTGDKTRNLYLQVIFNPGPADLTEAVSLGIVFVRFLEVIKNATFGTDHPHDYFP
jgi:hypothetical protein